MILCPYTQEGNSTEGGGISLQEAHIIKVDKRYMHAAAMTCFYVILQITAAMSVEEVS